MKRSFLSVVAVLAIAGAAHADIDTVYCADFEAPDFAVGILTDQDGWFVPAVAGSQNFHVAAYDASVATNPNGGKQYAVGQAVSTTDFGRAQHNIPFDASMTYKISYDVNVLPWTGTAPPALNNIGSISTQNSATSRFTQSLFLWTDTNNPSAGYSAQFANINAAGTNTGFVTATPAFANLLTNNWYQHELTFDFATNRLLSFSISDLTTLTTTTVEFTDVYLGGGADNALGLSMVDAIRMFAAGDPNNKILYDNLCVTVVPAPGAGLLALAGLAAIRRRR